MATSLLRVHLLSAVLETVLYGIFLILAVLSQYLLIKREDRQHRRINLKTIIKRPLIVANALLFLLVTAHWVLTIVRLFDAFLVYEAGPLHYYGDLSQPIYLARLTCLQAAVALCDLMMMYRLWLVWNRRLYLVVIPSLSVCGVLATGAAILNQLSKLAPGEPPFKNPIKIWITVQAVFILITTIYCTALIAWRISRVDTIADGAPSLNRAVAILIESAALYAAWIIIILCTYAKQSISQYIIIDLAPMIAGLSFSLLNVRVGLGLAQGSFQERNYAEQHSLLVFNQPGPNRTQVDSNTQAPTRNPPPQESRTETQTTITLEDENVTPGKLKGRLDDNGAV